jgi:hypothetical protein
MPGPGRIDARRGEVDAGSFDHTRLNQREEQTATPATELEHRPVGRVHGQEPVSETLRHRGQAWVLAFRQAFGHLGVEMSGDPRIGRACTRLPIPVGPGSIVLPSRSFTQS